MNLEVLTNYQSKGMKEWHWNHDLVLRRNAHLLANEISAIQDAMVRQCSGFGRTCTTRSEKKADDIKIIQAILRFLPVYSCMMLKI